MEPYDDDRALGSILESLPDPVVAALEVRDAWRKQLADSTAGLEFIVSDLARWPVGSVVRVAFLDGDTALHADVAAATKQITDDHQPDARLRSSIRRPASTGAGTETDTVLQAEIRVSFDMPGYWSLVGTDSTDATIDPGGPIGGGPGQRSLNLGGYKTSKPQGWQGTVRHEFLHALAFQHEHQNMRGPCSNDFRWDNDPGYVPTTNAGGVFVPDAQGRRPGIYTYLAGPPNQWSKAKVDHNLRTVEDPDAVAGPFDAASVMLYRFAPFFYKSSPSPCAPTAAGSTCRTATSGACSSCTRPQPKRQCARGAVDAGPGVDGRRQRGGRRAGRRGRSFVGTRRAAGRVDGRSRGPSDLIRSRDRATELDQTVRRLSRPCVTDGTRSCCRCRSRGSQRAVSTPALAGFRRRRRPAPPTACALRLRGGSRPRSIPVASVPGARDPRGSRRTEAPGCLPDRRSGGSRRSTCGSARQRRATPCSTAAPLRSRPVTPPTFPSFTIVRRSFAASSTARPCAMSLIPPWMTRTSAPATAVEIRALI